MYNKNEADKNKAGDCSALCSGDLMLGALKTGVIFS